MSENKADPLREALESACGYLMNAKIDLETGCTKATAIRTIEGGLKKARAALAAPQPAAPLGGREAIDTALRAYFKSRFAPVQLSSGGVERVYCNGFPINGLIDAILATTPQERGVERSAAIENLREVWSALAMIMIRETIETLGPVGAVKASEHLDGPTFMHEADALVAGIRALAGKETVPAKELPQ